MDSLWSVSKVERSGDGGLSHAPLSVWTERLNNTPFVVEDHVPSKINMYLCIYERMCVYTWRQKLLVEVKISSVPLKTFQLVLFFFFW